MSLVPMGGNKISPNPWLIDNYPDAYINMGLGTENIAARNLALGASRRISSPRNRIARRSLLLRKENSKTDTCRWK